MRKLLRANLERLRKNGMFWGMNVFLVLFCVLVCVVQFRNAKAYEVSTCLDNFIFGSFQVIGIVLAIFVSLFVGTEYSDGTIRNKVIVGKSRAAVYLSNIVTCSLGAAVGVLLAILFTMAVGIPLFGFFQTEAFKLLLLLAVYLLAVIAYTSVYNMVAMLCPNKAYTAVINMLVAFLLLFLTIYLYQRLAAPEMIEEAMLPGGESHYMVLNPSYLSGIKRKMFQFFFDFFPGGQAMQVAALEVRYPWRLMLYSAMITVLTNGFGVFFFRRKDIR